jgi:hypothetical protein
LRNIGSINKISRLSFSRCAEVKRERERQERRVFLLEQLVCPPLQARQKGKPRGPEEILMVSTLPFVREDSSMKVTFDLG